MILNKTTIVLVRPQLPENIGMVARTMDNFGFKNLILVLPREKWPNKKSLQASKHAKKIIENTKLYFNIEEALKKFNLVIATSNRSRHLQKRTFNNFLKFNQILIDEKKSAILFGPENSGLTNNELRLADYIFTIPTFGSNKSLNLSHAVSIITYKLNEKKLMIKNLKKATNIKAKEQASKYEISEYMKFLIENLDKSNFFYPIEKRESMINNIFTIYSKSDLSKKELNMLWGILKKLRK